MRTIPVTVGGGTSQIVLGRRGENEATTVAFDLASLIGLYGDGEAVLMIKRPMDTTAYPVLLSRDGAKAEWLVSATDTAQRGRGSAEIFWYVGDLLAKTVVWTLIISEDIGEPGEVPDPYETWVETLTELGAETLANATAAQVAQEGAELAQEKSENAQAGAEIAQERAEASRVSAESAADRAEQAEASAEDWADKAEQAAGTSGWVEFTIDEAGHLIYTRAEIVDLDFYISHGNLFVEV